LEFRRDLWHQKTRIGPFVWYKNVAGRFFGLVTKHACDRRTDGQTDGRTVWRTDRTDRITTQPLPRPR